MSTKSKKLDLLLCQDWIEYERGWGTRPDGCSLHKSEADHKAFCEAYWARMPKGEAPEEYSSEHGKPYLVIVDTILCGKVMHGVGNGLWVTSGDVRSGLVRRATPDEILSVHSHNARTGE